jgi:N-carbamoyl-L-amino-acid hydrolase
MPEARTLDTDIARRAAAAVDGARLLAQHEALAAIGRIPPSGLNRTAFSQADTAARQLLLRAAQTRGRDVLMDDIGNTFVVRPGTNPDALPIVTGSHVDSQPAGGPFDGQFGVIAAFETLEALDDAGITTRHPVWAAVWSNEEGARFQPTTMGSAVFVGELALQEALAARDSEGTLVVDELARMKAELPATGRLPLGARFAAYIEAHIEQGPIMEKAGIPLGVVTSIQGLRWFTVTVTGATGHAGTTPVAGRRDALVAAHHILRELGALMEDPDDVVRFTVGRFEVRPNSPNTIPGEVLFSIDFRHPDGAVLERLGDRVVEICDALSGPCSVSVTETLFAPPTVLDAGISHHLRQVATALGYSYCDIVSGATHDAKLVARTCPTGMLFIPCRDGISHSTLEYAEPEHMIDGTRALAAAVAALATS